MRSRALVVIVTLAATVMVSGVALAQESAPWLHIRVTEDGDDGARVAVNLPLSLVQVFADIAEQEIERELMGRRGHLADHLDRHDLQVADIRRAWHELRDTGDAEFVEVADGDDYVRVSRAGDRIFIEFDERGERGNGRVEVPVSVIDALLEGEGERLNVRAAIDQMIATADGEIAFVDDGRTAVRIWIE